MNFADRFAQVDSVGRRHLQPRALVAGQLEEPLLIAPTGVVDLVGVRFKPSGLYPVLGGLAMSELNGQRVDLLELCPALAQSLAGCAVTNSAQDRLRRIELALGRWLETQPRSRSRSSNGVTRGAVEILERGGTMPEVQRWCADTDVTERSLQRAFRREVGVSAKLLARVLRFQRAYQLLESADDRGVFVESVAGLAIDCGYYDQSHLIRDFRQFAGRTPGANNQETLSRFFGGIAT